MISMICYMKKNKKEMLMNYSDTENGHWQRSLTEINLEPYGNLFKPSDFNKNVFELKKEIHLLPGNYTLNAILRSKPGSYITIVMSNKDVFSFSELP